MQNNTASGQKGLAGTWLILAAIIIIIIAGILWLTLGSKNSNKPNNSSTTKSQPSQPAKQNANERLNSLISYKLPEGWTDTDCIEATETILIIPSGQLRLNCATDLQSWPIRIVKDTNNTTSCNQIKVDNSQVTNHICSSVPVDGQRFLKSSTTYNDKSAYGHSTKVSDYYVKTSGSVIKLEYVDNLTTNTDDYQTGFDQLANSVQVKTA